MDSFMELVKSRRSIRFYAKREIQRSDLEVCVEAASRAPSACNSQPWKFIIVDDSEVKRSVAEILSSGTYNMNALSAKATAYIVIVSEHMKLSAWAGAKLLNMDYKRIDIGLACSQLILQAQELGIGSCILGWFNERKLKKLLKIPRSKRIELVISMGYSGDYRLKEKKLKDKKEVIAFNSYHND